MFRITASVLCQLMYVNGNALAAAKERRIVVVPPIPAPNLTLPAIQNADGELSLADFRGNVTYVDFWASWCGPCRLSLPALNALDSQFAGEPVQFLAISIDVVEEDAWDFLERYPVNYPVVIDKEGDVARSFAVDGMPSGYLLDGQGRVREIHIGFQRGDERQLAESIKELLAEMDDI